MANKPIPSTQRGNGKLLITGEYLVLDGALALALPVSRGQSLTFTYNEESSDTLVWKSLDNQGQEWVNKTFSKSIKSSYVSPDDQSFHALLKHTVFEDEKLAAVTCRLAFDRQWGLGSSSTLIYCLANHYQCNPYELSAKSFGGSGYDIACAGHHSPILYQRNLEEPYSPTVEQATWSPIFTDQIYFIYLGKKQNSRDAIAHYKELNQAEKPIGAMNELTQSVNNSADFKETAYLIQKHEHLMASVLKTPCLDEKLWKDPALVSKSLGAWGGDFCMVLFQGPIDDLRKIASRHGLDTVLPWSYFSFDSPKPTVSSTFIS
jgi:mevalonate kinase